MSAMRTGLTGEVRSRPLRRSPAARATQSGGRVIVRRIRLEQLLGEAGARPLTLVYAAAGTGKTTIVADWLRRSRACAAWVALDRSHNDSQSFWHAIEAALRRAGVLGPRGHPGLRRARPSAGRLGPSGGRRPEFSADAIRDCLAGRSTPVRLILDDAQRLDRADGLAALIDIARQTPLRVILCTRTAPALGLGRLRLDDEVAEIGPAELAFTTDEADSLLRAEGLAVPPSEVADIVRRAEGWAAALRLAARAVREGRLASLGAFAAELPEMVEYLQGEVLDPLPDDARDLLLRTSADPWLSIDLAEAITGCAHAGRILDRLSRDGLVAERVDGDGHWYRLPTLLRQCLLHLARIELADELPALRARSARWWQDHERRSRMAVEPPPQRDQAITEREAVVLRYLPSRLTGREIAAELHVSPNTIKTQIKSIYRKLAVYNRRSAVERARRLGLL